MARGRWHTAYGEASHVATSQTLSVKVDAALSTFMVTSPPRSRDCDTGCLDRNGIFSNFEWIVVAVYISLGQRIIYLGTWNGQGSSFASGRSEFVVRCKYRAGGEGVLLQGDGKFAGGCDGHCTGVRVNDQARRSHKNVAKIL